MARRPVFAHPIAIASLALTALVYAHPLVLGFGSVTPGLWSQHGVAVTVWNAWWFDQGMTGAARVFDTGAILTPFGADLRLHAYGPLFSLIALPFTRWLGYVGAVNVAVLVTLFLNGAVAYWLLNREMHQRAAALLGATFLMLAVPSTNELFGGRAATAAIWTIAAALGAAGSLLERPRVWNVAGLALALIAALFSDLQLFLAALLWLGIYLTGRVLHDGRRSFDAKRIAAIGTAGAVALAPFAALYAPALRSGPSVGYALPSSEQLAAESLRLMDYVDPWIIQSAYGYGLLAAAILTLLLFGARTEYRVWLCGALVFLLLALGPSLHPTAIALPVALATWVPLLSFIDAPRLFLIPAALGLSAVAAFLGARVFHRLPARGAVAPVALGLIAVRLAIAVSLYSPAVQAHPVYDTYLQIAADTESTAILEVPFGVRSGTHRLGSGGEALQFFQPMERIWRAVPPRVHPAPCSSSTVNIHHCAS